MGYPVSDPVTTFLELATLTTFEELVAIGDFFVLDPRVLDPGDPRPYAHVEELRAAGIAARGRGVKLARRAGRAVRQGVESPMETALRLLLLAAGLPEPVCGFELRDGRVHVGWFDLAWPEFRVIAEYDGDVHRASTRQYDRDILRYDLASDLEWRVIRVRSRGLFVHPTRTIERVANALSRGGYAPSGLKGTRRAAESVRSRTLDALT